jgi:hypothetical protein
MKIGRGNGSTRRKPAPVFYTFCLLTRSDGEQPLRQTGSSTRNSQQRKSHCWDKQWIAVKLSINLIRKKVAVQVRVPGFIFENHWIVTNWESGLSHWWLGRVLSLFTLYCKLLLTPLLQLLLKKALLLWFILVIVNTGHRTFSDGQVVRRYRA